jgi:hypothetical protein
LDSKQLTLLLDTLWQALPEHTRNKVLQTLARLLIQQTSTPPCHKEVTHEQS